jgi:hypothetical protein
LGIHNLPVKFPAKDAKAHVKAQKEALGGRHFPVILFGESVGYLLAGEHGKEWKL